MRHFEGEIKNEISTLSNLGNQYYLINIDLRRVTYRFFSVLQMLLQMVILGGPMESLYHTITGMLTCQRIP